MTDQPLDRPLDPSAGLPVTRLDPSELSPEQERALATLVEVLTEAELTWEHAGPTSLAVELPGEKKLKTPVRFDVGPHSLSVHAFCCRQPDENHEVVYRWLLERNMKTFGVSFALDGVGDIYLDGRLPLEAVTATSVDRLLGSVLEHADGSFNVILELGFADSIRKEWVWRVTHGESVRNLEAFRGPLALDELGSPADETR